MKPKPSGSHEPERLARLSRCVVSQNHIVNHGVLIDVDPLPRLAFLPPRRHAMDPPASTSATPAPSAPKPNAPPPAHDQAKAAKGKQSSPPSSERTVLPRGLDVLTASSRSNPDLQPRMLACLCRPGAVSDSLTPPAESFRPLRVVKLHTLCHDPRLNFHLCCTASADPGLTSAEKSLFPNSMPVRQTLPSIHSFSPATTSQQPQSPYPPPSRHSQPPSATTSEHKQQNRYSSSGESFDVFGSRSPQN